MKRDGVGQINERDCPPSALMQAPVTKLDRSEARKQTTLAISSTVPNLPIGNSFLINSAIPSGSARHLLSQLPPGNLIDPGATEFTRIPSEASSEAITFAKLIKAAFDEL